MVSVEELPVGFTFCPSEAEVVWYYLKRRLEGALSELETALFPTIDFLSVEPWELAGLPQLSFQSRLLCSDVLKAAHIPPPGILFFWEPGLRGARIGRTTVRGFWKSSGPDKEMMRPQTPGGDPITSAAEMAGRAPDVDDQNAEDTRFPLTPDGARNIPGTGAVVCSERGLCLKGNNSQHSLQCIQVALPSPKKSNVPSSTPGTPTDKRRDKKATLEKSQIILAANAQYCNPTLGILPTHTSLDLTSASLPPRPSLLRIPPTTRGSSDQLALGARKTLVFHFGKAPQEEKSGWYVYEYRILTGDALRALTIREDQRKVQPGARGCSIVACRLLYKPEKQQGVKTPVKRSGVQPGTEERDNMRQRHEKYGRSPEHEIEATMKRRNLGNGNHFRLPTKCMVGLEDKYP